MGKKVKQPDDDYGKVNLSPMIDCCFLLLIFFVVNATALTVSKDPSVTMPQAVDPTDLEDAKGCIVINVFAPEEMEKELSHEEESVRKGAQARLDKMAKTYKASNKPNESIHYGVTSGEDGGKPEAYSENDLKGKNKDTNPLAKFVKKEKERWEGLKNPPEKIRIYIRADSRASWERTFRAIEAANMAGVPDIVFGSVPAKEK